MTQYTIKIEGMMCGMCESHINDTIRKNFNVKKLKTSHTKGTSTFQSEEDITEEAIHKAIDPTGYTVLSVEKGAPKKKGLFGF